MEWIASIIWLVTLGFLSQSEALGKFLASIVLHQDRLIVSTIAALCCLVGCLYTKGIQSTWKSAHKKLREQGRGDEYRLPKGWWLISGWHTFSTLGIVLLGVIPLDVALMRRFGEIDGNLIAYWLLMGIVTSIFVYNILFRGGFRKMVNALTEDLTREAVCRASAWTRFWDWIGYTTGIW